MDDISKIILLYLVIINIISFIIIGLDKYYAIRNKWRIREYYFFIISIFGGSLGILFGMYVFHHKTKKKKFTIIIPLILIIEILLYASLT